MLREDIQKLESVFLDDELEGYKQFVLLVNNYRNKMVDQLIGSIPPKKLDELK